MTVAAPKRRRHIGPLPLAGLAIAAVAGIGFADVLRRCVLLHPWDENHLAQDAGAMFLALVAVFAARRRAWLFWTALVVGFAALHLFNCDPVPAGALARALATPDAVGHGSHVVRGIGRVDGPPKRLPPGGNDAPGTASWRFVLFANELTVDGAALPTRIWVIATWRNGPTTLEDGDWVSLTGLGGNFPGPRNPGEIDFAALQRRRGIFSQWQVMGGADGRVIAHPGPGPAATLARTVRQWMERTLRIGLAADSRESAVVTTMLLGLREDPGLGEMEPMFQRTGTLHYFAIDGLKLGLIGVLMRGALIFCGMPRRYAWLATLPVLGLYALAAGLGPPAWRALLVGAALVVGVFIDQPARPINFLAGAALILLCADTNELFAIDFQLTFGVVLAILLLTPSLSRWLKRWGEPDPFLPVPLYSSGLRAWEALRRRTCDLFAVALAAWLGSLPVMWLVFHLLSPISPFANVAAFPLAFAIVALGTLGLAGAWAHWWVTMMNKIAWLAAHSLLACVGAFDTVPFSSFAVAGPGAWRLGDLPLAEIDIFDLGGARAAHLQAPDADWLLDTGRNWNFSHTVQPALQASGFTRFGRTGGIILTRADADHLGAAALAVTELRPRQLIDGALPERSLYLRDLRRSLDPAILRESRVRRGNVVDLAPGVSAHVLYPPDDPPPGAPVTAASRALVLRLDAGAWHVLVLPDGTDGRAAQWLLANEQPDALHSTVLVCDAPVTTAFVQAVGARAVIVRFRPVDNDTPLPPLALPTLRGVDFVSQEDAGAVNARLYPDRIELRGFVDGRKISLLR